MKDLGIKAYRMSLSWPRILPEGVPSKPNPYGIEHYKILFNELLQAGIEPWVTLYHWDLPSALNDKTDKGGWLSPNITEKFKDYADFCFQTFGSQVKKWITLNEP